MQLLQVRRRSSHARQRRSTATPKPAEHAELMEEDVGPSPSTVPPQHIGHEIQQSLTQGEAAEGGAASDGPSDQTPQQAGSGQFDEGQRREVPKTLASRLSATVAGMFSGRKSSAQQPETQAGK